jgi:hypothetical protein
MDCRCSTFAPNTLTKYGWRDEHWAACDDHADEREAIRCQVLAEFRAKFGAYFPSTTAPSPTATRHPVPNIAQTTATLDADPPPHSSRQRLAIGTNQSRIKCYL